MAIIIDYTTNVNLHVTIEITLHDVAEKRNRKQVFLNINNIVYRVENKAQNESHFLHENILL